MVLYTCVLDSHGHKVDTGALHASFTHTSDFPVYKQPTLKAGGQKVFLLHLFFHLSGTSIALESHNQIMFNDPELKTGEKDAGYKDALQGRKWRWCVCRYLTGSAEEAGSRLVTSITRKALSKAALSRENTEYTFRSVLRASEIISGLIFPPLVQHYAQLISPCPHFVHVERDCKGPY